MSRYIIKEIHGEGYERVARVSSADSKELYIVHYLECDEYLEHNNKPKRREGQILSGEVFIDFVSTHNMSDKELMFRQSIDESPHIEAVVEVAQIIDEYSIKANSSLQKEPILIEFEEIVSYKMSDKVYIEGSLEIDINN